MSGTPSPTGALGTDFPQARVRLFADAATLVEREAGGVPTRTSLARAAPDRLEPKSEERPEATTPSVPCALSRTDPLSISTARVSEKTNWPVPRNATISAEMLRARWNVAFDAARAALHHADPYLPAKEAHRRATLLGAELDLTIKLLRALARDQHASGHLLPLKFASRDAGTHQPIADFASSAWPRRPGLGGRDGSPERSRRRVGGEVRVFARPGGLRRSSGSRNPVRGRRSPRRDAGSPCR
jgi:hypothetical protein